MTDIYAGDEITVANWPVSVSSQDSTAISNITSTTAIPGSPEVGMTFTAPPSGRIGLIVAADMRNQDTAGNRVFVTAEVYEGTSASGTLIQAGEAVRGVSTSGDTSASQFQLHGNMSMVEGLTSGATHYARVVYFVAGGTTNDIQYRRVTVVPLP